jgi:hypothetical protein
MWNTLNRQYVVALARFTQSAHHDPNFYPFCDGNAHLRACLFVKPNLTTFVNGGFFDDPISQTSEGIMKEVGADAMVLLLGRIVRKSNNIHYRQRKNRHYKTVVSNRMPTAQLHAQVHCRHVACNIGVCADDAVSFEMLNNIIVNPPQCRQTARSSDRRTGRARGMATLASED